MTSILLPEEGWHEASSVTGRAFGLAVNARGDVVAATASSLSRIGAEGQVGAFRDKTPGLHAVAFGPEGKLYAIDGQRRRVVAYDADGRETVTAEGILGHGLAATHSGLLYVTEPSRQQVWLVDDKGHKRVVDKGIPEPTGIALTPDQSLLLVADARGIFVYSATILFAGMLSLGAVTVALALAGSAPLVDHVSFPAQDGGLVFADGYGRGPHAVVLAHGARFNKESWEKQARALATAGFSVLAIDFRGYGQSRGPGQADVFTAPLYLDVLAAVRYLRAAGATRVSVIGGSMGGAAAGDASIHSDPGEIDSVVLLGAAPNAPAEKLKSPTLFLLAREDTSGSGPRLPGIRAQYEKAPEPKRLILLEGSAHAQFLFQSDQAERVMGEILAFLANPKAR